MFHFFSTKSATMAATQVRGRYAAYDDTAILRTRIVKDDEGDGVTGYFTTLFSMKTESQDAEK